MNNNIRIHLPAIPYTITRDEFSHDAFTGKVKRFSPMMRSRGFEVFHYGVETSESGANQDIDIMTKDEWTALRIESLMFLEPALTYEEAVNKHNDITVIPNHHSNWSTPLSIQFNKRLKEKLKENYRSNKTDIVCIPLSRMYEHSIKDCGYICIEIGIGYLGSYLDYRIFESHSWLSYTLGIEHKTLQNYWFVIPHAFNTNEYKLSLNPTPLKIGFLGRIETFKGCSIIVELASKFPMVQFVLCGGGNPEPFLKHPNIIYKKPIHGTERSEYLGDCIAVLSPTIYLEPFGCAQVEAQLCGTPVICSDGGGMTETVEQFKTGLRCHTLADYCYGVQMALDGKFDRTYIRNRAVSLYDMYKLAYNYEYIFKSVLDVWNPNKNGWYSPDKHIESMDPDVISITGTKCLLNSSILNTDITQIHDIQNSIINTNIKTNTKLDVIPKKIWQTWATKDLPLNMADCVKQLKLSHTDFEYNLFDDEDCYSFIKEHFPIEVLYAYETLIPSAYKSDLWRLCVLYMYGGVYLDIKLQFCDNYTLHDFIDKEYFVCDGKSSIYNGVLICKKHNVVILQTLLNIVYNVSNNYYGDTPYSVTGPLLIGKIFEIYNKPVFELSHYGPKSNETIRKSDKIIFTHYKEYRQEQSSTIKNPYYENAWYDKNIYNNNNKLCEIYKQHSWSTQFKELFKIVTPRIYIFLVYFGTFPNYFQLYLDSLRINTDILTLFLITDIDITSYSVPDNLILINLNIQNVRQRASQFILKTYNKVVEPENLILNNYKLVDFKIIFPLLFDDVIKKYNVTSNDYIGWGDCDIIYGKISNFIHFDKPYEIIGGIHGHFAAIKNNDSFKNNFINIPNYFNLITDNSKTFIVDEIAYREPLMKYLADNNFNMFNTHMYFCDIVPPCFYYLFRPNFAEHKINFFDVYNASKNIKHLCFNGKLYVQYDDGEYKEVFYCHLQKRKMELTFNSYESGYYINENSFTLTI